MSLYEKLARALQENKIDELGLLPFIPDVASLPLESAKYYPLVVVECKLGIELSVLSSLLKESHAYYISLSQNDKEKIQQVTRAMILLKPDNYTAMNRRKELMLSGYIDPKDELSLIELIFTLPRHSKSSLAWFHRRWILTHFSDSLTLNIKHELELCTKTTLLYPRNYYAWTYRYWLLERNSRDNLSIVAEEYENTCNWLGRNISDFSGFQYLQQVMKLLPELRYEEHMKWLNDLIIRYPGHESLWCHRRFCSTQFYNHPNYSRDQHQFVSDILKGRFESEDLSNNPKDTANQKTFALKFGLWQFYMEKEKELSTDESLLKLYSKVAPTSTFL